MAEEDSKKRTMETLQPTTKQETCQNSPEFALGKLGDVTGMSERKDASPLTRASQGITAFLDRVQESFVL